MMVDDRCINTHATSHPSRFPSRSAFLPSLFLRIPASLPQRPAYRVRRVPGSAGA